MSEQYEQVETEETPADAEATPVADEVTSPDAVEDTDAAVDVEETPADDTEIPTEVDSDETPEDEADADADA
ncbi:MAG: hypothetical protein Q7J48_20290, partial [Nocardioides sp.]|nr:hypothetical protein [Nocardioides sp.]